MIQVLWTLTYSEYFLLAINIIHSIFRKITVMASTSN
jgi:hypothetical protein